MSDSYSFSFENTNDTIVPALSKPALVDLQMILGAATTALADGPVKVDSVHVFTTPSGRQGRKLRSYVFGQYEDGTWVSIMVTGNTEFLNLKLRDLREKGENEAFKYDKVIATGSAARAITFVNKWAENVWGNEGAKPTHHLHDSSTLTGALANISIGEGGKSGSWDGIPLMEAPAAQEERYEYSEGW